MAVFDRRVGVIYTAWWQLIACVADSSNQPVSSDNNTGKKKSHEIGNTNCRQCQRYYVATCHIRQLTLFCDMDVRGHFVMN